LTTHIPVTIKYSTNGQSRISRNGHEVLAEDFIYQTKVKERIAEVVRFALNLNRLNTGRIVGKYLFAILLQLLFELVLYTIRLMQGILNIPVRNPELLTKKLSHLLFEGILEIPEMEGRNQQFIG
jgi:hypothetical protein